MGDNWMNVIEKIDIVKDGDPGAAGFAMFVEVGMAHMHSAVTSDMTIRLTKEQAQVLHDQLHDMGFRKAEPVATSVQLGPSTDYLPGWQKIELSGEDVRKGMMFRKKPVVVEAWRWTRDQDVPSEFRPQKYALGHDEVCALCGMYMQLHGWIDTLEGIHIVGGHIVCPGDWIVTGVKGERYPVKPDIFKETYEEVADGH